MCCCLRRRTAGVVGCCLSVVFSWPGRTGRPPERVCCAVPLSWQGRTGRPPERVRCATPCFCFAGVAALLLVVLCSLVSVRFLALRRCLSPPAAVPPPPPTPPRPSACCVPPPPCFLVPQPAVPPPPLPGGMPFPAGCLALIYPCCLCALWLAVCWRFLLPPPPGRVSWVLAPAARFPLSSCFCLVFSVPLALAPVWLGFVFPPRLVLVPPPPLGGCSWWSAVPRVLFCGAVVWGGLLCAARGVLLRRAVLLCGCLAVWCACLLCRWPCPVGVGHALSVGVARCSASPRCFVGCFVVCGAVVRCRVLRCFPCCSVVSWLFSLCFLGFVHLRVCAAWCCPPPPWFVCRAFCRFVLPRCAGLFCPLWRRVAACCVVLFGVQRAVSCCAVSCCAPRVVWCCAAIPRAAASCCVLCRARWCCAVLSCVAPFAGVLRPGALCCAVPLCAVVGCFVPSGVRWRCAVGCVLCCAVVCCCVLCCAFGRGVWLRCAVLSSLWLAVSFWSRCPVLYCASWCCVGLCRVVLCCVVLCCVVVRCAVRWVAASWCSVLCCPTVCCRGLLCAPWCPLALCGWLRAVPRCCLLPFCAAPLGVVSRCAVLCCPRCGLLFCFGCAALCCAVLCLLVLCWAMSRRVVLCGSVLLCTALWGWHCAALSRGLWCRFPLWRALGCCAVPRVLCALLRAVLCCCVLCPAWGCGVLVRCAVLFASCLAVWSGSVFLCGVLCLLVLWCSALHPVVSCGVVLLRTVLFAWCCAVFARAVWCWCVLCLALGVVPRCGVLCRLVRCFAVVPRAVRAALCVFCCCVVVCAVLAAVRCAASALWCYPRAFSKPEKTVSHFQKQKKLFSAGLPCVPCPPCMQQYHTLKKPASFIYLIPCFGLVCTAGLGLESCGCVLGVLDTVHLQQKGGQTRRGWGSNGRRRYMENKKGREAASAGA